MNAIWPQSQRADTNGVIRLGRVLHWFFALVAAAFVIGGVVWVSSGSSLDAVLGLNGTAALVSLLIGRALRYVFAGE